jgi:hypothetical protein
MSADRGHLRAMRLLSFAAAVMRECTVDRVSRVIVSQAGELVRRPFLYPFWSGISHGVLVLRFLGVVECWVRSGV